MDNSADPAASFVEKLTDPTHRWTPADYDCIPELVDVVVEIVSKNANLERTEKWRAYEEDGIPAYIIVDGPDGKRFAEVYHLEDGRYTLTKSITPSGMGSFTVPFTFAIDMMKIND